MNTRKKNLKKRLPYLSLDLHEKVLLWLAYKELKPVSEITIERRNYPVLRRMVSDKKFRDSYVGTFNYNSPKIKRIEKWLNDAGLYKAVEAKHSKSWHVGKDKTKVIQSAKIIKKFDYENECKSGILFGFPNESVKAYAHNRVGNFKKNQIPMVGTGNLRFSNPYLKNKYYTPYIFYSIRKDRVVEDSKVAKTWADTIRKDIPLLARWYENSQKKAGRQGL